MNVQESNPNPMVVVNGCCPNCARSAAFWGIVLIIFSGLGLLSAFVPQLNVGRYLLPAFFLAWGIYLLSSRLVRQ